MNRAWIVMLLAAGSAIAWAQQSPSFVMERACVGGGAETLLSASFVNTAVLGADMPFGTTSSCAGGIQTNIGYCLVTGEIPAPIELDVRHNPSDPAAADVIWNGAAAIYQLYRDFDPVAVVTPGNLFAETPDCQVTDGSSAGHDLVFYNVVPRP